MDAINLTTEYEMELMHLHLPIESIDENFTLYDLFAMVHGLEDLYPGIAAIFGMPCFDQFWNRICLDRDDGDSDEVEYLELYWHVGYDTIVTPMTEEEKVEWQKHHDYSSCIFEGKNNYWDNIKQGELSDLMAFHGVGDFSAEDIEQWPEYAGRKCWYSIGFTPVNNLKHLPIVIKEEVNFFQPFLKKGTELSRTGFILTRSPSLWTFITSVFWGITFYGFMPQKDREEENDNN
ncbi:hypothetical protein LCGC14_2102040 [marine sediment metagenome]|uniref:Uncharacterized protein n=1 Tax=marine sediment metagenome TaxID=412755 RepID=A0A0F9EWT4_9ZZZZ